MHRSLGVSVNRTTNAVMSSFNHEHMNGYVKPLTVQPLESSNNRLSDASDIGIVRY